MPQYNLGPLANQRSRTPVHPSSRRTPTRARRVMTPGRTSGWVSAGRDPRTGYTQLWVDERVLNSALSRGGRLVTGWRAPTGSGPQQYVGHDIRMHTRNAYRVINGRKYYAAWVNPQGRNYSSRVAAPGSR